nr:deoxyhypusine synthase family protein [Sphingomonas sp.]
MTAETLTKPEGENKINDTRKAELLSSPVEHIDIKSFDARPIVDAMRKMSFTSRDLGRATDIYNMMLEDKDCSIILVVAGSTSAGGCMDLYADLVRNNMVDAIVATGATIVDMDFFEALGHKHYQANEIPDDDTLRSLYIDRIYDTYIDEEKLQETDFTIGKIADSLEPRPYSSREFIKHMGKWLSEGNAKKDGSLVQLAYEHDVPIFCPAF